MVGHQAFDFHPRVFYGIRQTETMLPLVLDAIKKYIQSVALAQMKTFKIQARSMFMWAGHLDNSYSRRFVPRTTRAQVNYYPRRLVPRTTHVQDKTDRQMTDAFVVFDIFRMESGSTHDYDLEPSSYSHTITRFWNTRNCQLSTHLPCICVAHKATSSYDDVITSLSVTEYNKNVK